MAFEVPPAPLLLRSARAAHRRGDDAPASRQAPPGVRRQGQRRLEGTEWDGKPVEDVLQNLDSLPADKQKAVRNNGGGHYNHSLFWEWMSPDGGGESRAARWPTRSRARSARSTTSRPSSRRPASTSSARAGRGSSTTAPASRWSAPRTRTTRSPRPDAAARRRRLGARLLPQVPEQAPGLHRRVVERGRLGQGRRALRLRRLTDSRVLRGGVCAKTDAAEAERMGRWRALGARSKARVGTLVAGWGCARRRWSRSAAAMGPCWPRWPGAASPACSTASSCHPPRRATRATAAWPGGWRRSTASTFPRRRTSTTSRCSRTCSSTSPTPCRS